MQDRMTKDEFFTHCVMVLGKPMPGYGDDVVAHVNAYWKELKRVRFEHPVAGFTYTDWELWCARQNNRG